MAYPIKDAGYKHEPPWLDRAKEGERHSKVPYRQDGGPLPRTTPAGGMDQVDMDNAVKDHENNMRFTQGPLSAAAKGLRNPGRNTPLPSNWDDATSRRRGGKVKRADGGQAGPVNSFNPRYNGSITEPMVVDPKGGLPVNPIGGKPAPQGLDEAARGVAMGAGRPVADWELNKDSEDSTPEIDRIGRAPNSGW